MSIKEDKNKRVIWLKWLFQLNRKTFLFRLHFIVNYLRGSNVVAMSTIVANRLPIVCRMTSVNGCERTRSKHV